MIVHGQMHGGIAQGIGQALLENINYDDDGQLTNASFMDYCMPRADDMPSFQTAFINTPTPNNPLGMKGCGFGLTPRCAGVCLRCVTNQVFYELHVLVPVLRD